jgi:hypothetical protein
MKISINELRSLRKLLCCRKPKLVVGWTISAGAFVTSFTGDWTMALLHDDKTISASIAFKNSKTGKVAPVDGLPTWSVDNEAVVTMVVAADGMSAVFTPGTDLGTATVTVSADADLGAGVRTITSVGALTVVAAEADTVELTFGPEQ